MFGRSASMDCLEAMSSQAVSDSVVHSLLLSTNTDIVSSPQTELELKCKSYLLDSGKASPVLLSLVEEFEKSKAKKLDKKERKLMDILQDTFDIHSVKKNIHLNHSLRFTLQNRDSGSFSAPVSAAAIDTHQTSSSNSISVNNSSSSTLASGAATLRSDKTFNAANSGATTEADIGEKSDYEDVTDPEILNAPICDICIVQKGQKTPVGFYRISRTIGNKKANLNTSSGGTVIYLCIKKDLTGSASAITSLVMFYPDKSEFLPPGCGVVKCNNIACNFATGSSSEYTDRIFLAYKKSKGGNPLTDIQVILPDRGEEAPNGFNLLTNSPTGWTADCNFGNKDATRIHLCYRQILPKLECLLKEVVDLSDIPVRNKQGGTSPMQESERSITSRSGSVDYSTEAHFDESRSEGEAAYSHSNKGESNSNYQQSELDESSARSLDINDDVAALNQRIASKSAVLYSDGSLVPRLTRKALYTILSALYNRYDHISMIAINGLIKLLRDTDFYDNDIRASPKARNLSLLDMTLDAICDRFDACNEKDFDSLLQFFRILIRRSNGRMPCSILHRIYRSVMFLSQYFSSKTSWFISDQQMPTADGGIELPVFKVMKELIKACHIQVEKPKLATSLLPELESSNNSLASMSSSIGLQDSNVLSSLLATASTDREPSSSSSIASSTSPLNKELTVPEAVESSIIIKGLIHEFIDNVVESVELHRITEYLLLVVNKQHVTVGSTYFWDEINSISKKLFSDFAYRSAFMVLAAVCKSSWHALPGNFSTSTVLANTHSGREKARELGNKLLALESVHEFLFWAGEKLHQSKVMGYLIRRLVVPCLLYNVNYAFADVRIFSKLLKIITALWKIWRVHIRLEFAILCENLVIRVLQAGQNAKPVYQMLVIQEVVSWFDQPYLMIEMFVNYDMDYKFVSNWNIFSHLVRSICGIARKANANYRISRDINNLNPNTVTSDLVNILALEQVCRITKTLMDASGHAHLIKRDSNFRARNASYGSGWDNDSNEGSADPARNEGGRRKSVVSVQRGLHEEAETLISEAIRIYKEKESVKKAINFLVSKGFLTDTPQEIASFLRVYKKSFDPTAIGDFLGEGGVKPSEVEYFNEIRFRYIRVVSFLELSLEPALRMFLTGCGFRLPGESQKIDRLVETFVKTFWQDNHGTIYCPFHNEDAIHIVSFAIIMLNTDLHRANADNKKGKMQKKMTKDQFINNLRGINNGDNVDREYLSAIYDNISEKPIELAFDSSERKLAGPSKTESSALSTLGGVASFLSREASTVNSEGIDEKSFILEVTRGLRDSEDLLRSLSVYNYHFQLTGAEDGGANMSLDLVTFMYETVSFHFQAVTESLLSPSVGDVHITECALDVSSHSITSSLFLDLFEEKANLASLLLKFQEAVTASPSFKRIQESVILDNSWKLAIDKATSETAMEGITKVHKMVTKLKDAVQQIHTIDELFRVASTTDKRDEIMKSNTKFYFEGDLQKKNRSGGSAGYHFLLFSNSLMYAHTAITGEYKVHQIMDIESIVITDPRPDDCLFIMNHPLKSFIVTPPSMDAKYLWIRAIGEAKDDARWQAQRALQKKQQQLQQQQPSSAL